MVFEVLGDNLLKIIIQHKYKGLPLNSVKSIAAQVNNSTMSIFIFNCIIITRV